MILIRSSLSVHNQHHTETLPVGEPEVILFLKSLRDNGVPAWQRLQAARAVEAYRQQILKTDRPSFVTIKRTLQRLAAQECNAVKGNTSVGSFTPDVVGSLPPDEPELVSLLRSDLRRLEYKYDTEKAYVGWIKRFIVHCKSPNLLSKSRIRVGQHQPPGVSPLAFTLAKYQPPRVSVRFHDHRKTVC